MTTRYLTDEQITNEIYAGGFYGLGAKRDAFCCICAESGGDADALNRNMNEDRTLILSTDYCIFQCNTIHKDLPGFDQVHATIPYGGNPGNARIAVQLWKREGFQPWVTWRARATDKRWPGFMQRAVVQFPEHGGTVTPFPLAAGEFIGVGGQVTSGPLVERVQLRLNDRGYDTGVPDGVVGPQFTSAVLAAQQKAPVTIVRSGKVDAATWKWFKP